MRFLWRHYRNPLLPIVLALLAMLFVDDFWPRALVGIAIAAAWAILRAVIGDEIKQRERDAEEPPRRPPGA